MAFNTTSKPDSNFLDNIFGSAEDSANELISNTAGTITSHLYIPDFYTVYMMNYCEGIFELNGKLLDSKNITYCSKRSALFRFDPAKVLENHLPSGVTLEDLKWPHEIDQVFKGI